MESSLAIQKLINFAGRSFDTGECRLSAEGRLETVVDRTEVESQTGTTNRWIMLRAGRIGTPGLRDAAQPAGLLPNELPKTSNNGYRQSLHQNQTLRIK